MKKKKILHLYPELNVSCGVTNSIRLITKNSKQYSHSVLTFGGDALSVIKENCDIIVIDRGSNIIDRSIKNFITLIKVCKQSEISILHSHHRYFDLLSFFASKVIKVSTITTVRSIVHGFKYLSYKAQKLVAISDFVKLHLVEYYEKEEKKIKIINNFFDPSSIKISKSKEEIRNELDIEKSRTIFGYFGRINFQEKSTDILIEIFIRISKQFDDVHLLIIGDGIDFLKAKMLINNNENIKLLRGQDDIHNYYQILDCFVLPSINETFGNVILEAGYHKIPVIANECGGIPEILKNDGILFKKDDFSDFEDKIIQFLNGEININKNVNSFFERVLDEFNPQLKIHDLENIYESL